MTTTFTVPAELPSAGRAAAARRRGQRAVSLRGHVDPDRLLPQARPSRRIGLGSLQWECEPENLLRVPPGRLALTATDEPTYRTAVSDLFITCRTEDIGKSYLRRTGWSRPSSHVSSWIVAFDPAAPGVLVTVGGGVRCEPPRTSAPDIRFVAAEAVGER
jgi:hypothetical protein